MKISRDWLQTYFETPLPDAEALADSLTFHAFEIDGIENDVLDVKITANRGHDCLSYRGIAKEVSAILNIPLKADPFTSPPELLPQTPELRITIDSPEHCGRYIGCLVRGAKIGPSPEWLVKRLAAQGQHSINNVVDAANFIMFDIGQPLHAFDAKKRTFKDGAYAIAVRLAHTGEKLTALDDKEYALTESMLMIADGNTDEPLGIAGVKGGKESGIWNDTTDLILESANFNGPSLRKTARTLRLRTDAVQRFEQVLSPEVAAYGMQAFAKLVQELAGGEIVGFADAYPGRLEHATVSVSLEQTNAVLGTSLTVADIENVFTRLGFMYSRHSDALTVVAPFERLDIRIPEDLIEEIGRIIGYDKIEAVELPATPTPANINASFYASENKRAELMAQGYSEVLTSVFAEKGERAVANKIEGVRPFMRTTLIDGLKDAYVRNMHNKDVLCLDEIKLFEIGTVWREDVEIIMLGMADKSGVRQEMLNPVMSDSYENLSTSLATRYVSFSRYPAIVRDIALWVPQRTTPESVLENIRKHAGELLVRDWKFDEFAKGERISYAFRMVFQSMDRTLFDTDVQERMDSIYNGVKEQGWEVR